MTYPYWQQDADARGRSVAVEYVDDEMVVTDTPVVTNFYLAEGRKNGIGTEQSHTRYEILTERLNQNETMDMQDVRDALSCVSKNNFGEFASTCKILLNGEALYASPFSVKLFTAL